VRCLTLRTLHALVDVDLGFATENRFSFKTNLTEPAYPDAARADRFYEQLSTKLESLPGTLSVGAISYLPLSGEGPLVTTASSDASGARQATDVTVGVGIVRGRYFETMPAARTVLASVDPSVPMYFADTVDGRYEQALALPRFTAGLVSAFSTLALILAGVGIFGVTGYAVAQRTREFGIRLALGAQRAHVGALVLRRVGLLAAIGVAIGTAIGLGLGSLMSGILFAVAPDDPLTITAVMGAIGLTAMLASLAPLRHAVLVNPVEILRAE
jgi:ABC-type antimicrobial peptide transport system permease subunit